MAEATPRWGGYRVVVPVVGITERVFQSWSARIRPADAEYMHRTRAWSLREIMILATMKELKAIGKTIDAAHRVAVDALDGWDGRSPLAPLRVPVTGVSVYTIDLEALRSVLEARLVGYPPAAAPRGWRRRKPAKR